MENKANEYADRKFAQIFNEPWPEFKQALADAYCAGATEALSGQWHSPESISGCNDRKVITMYRSKYEGTWLTLTSVESPEDWDKKTFHKKDDLIAWMPIPALPDDKY